MSRLSRYHLHVDVPFSPCQQQLSNRLAAAVEKTCSVLSVDSNTGITHSDYDSVDSNDGDDMIKVVRMQTAIVVIMTVMTRIMC